MRIRPLSVTAAVLSGILLVAVLDSCRVLPPVVAAEPRAVVPEREVPEEFFEAAAAGNLDQVRLVLESSPQLLESKDAEGWDDIQACRAQGSWGLGDGSRPPPLSDPGGSFIAMKRENRSRRKTHRPHRASPAPSRRKGGDPTRSPFGCTGELAEYFLSLSLTRDQERRIARSLRLAKRLAKQRGERIDSNEAALRVSRAFLDAHRDRGS